MGKAANNSMAGVVPLHHCFLPGQLSQPINLGELNNKLLLASRLGEMGHRAVNPDPSVRNHKIELNFSEGNRVAGSTDLNDGLLMLSLAGRISNRTRPCARRWLKPSRLSAALFM